MTETFAGLFLASWYAWNIINDNINDRVFDEHTKQCAVYLLYIGCRSNFIQCLANGDLQFPDEIVEVALEVERLDKIAGGRL